MSIVERLKSIGLTDYEARIYLALVEGQQLDARGLSQASEVPYSKIYEVVSRLEKKGLVEVHRGRPMLFRAASPDKALERWGRGYVDQVRQRFQEKLGEIERECSETVAAINKALEAVLVDLQRIYEDSPRLRVNEELVWTIMGKESVVSQALEVIREAKYVRMVLHDEFFGLLSSKMGGMRTRGEAIIQEGCSQMGVLPKKVKIYLMRGMVFQYSFIVSDNGETFFTTSDLSLGFKSRNPGLHTILSHFFEHEKEEATQIRNNKNRIL